MTATTYTVTAYNKFYWQKLAVKADSPGEAYDRFSEYLYTPQNSLNEQYEYEQQCNILGSHEDFDDDAPARSDYNYDFYEDDIEEDDTVQATEEVRVVESGGNG